MSEPFNFFASADPQYIFAYMDALALGEAPATGENSRDPFFVVYNYLKRELAEAQNALDELSRKVERQEQWQEACSTFRLARESMRKRLEANSPLPLADLAKLNLEFAWLVKKFHTALSFPLFSEDENKVAEFMENFRIDQNSKNSAQKPPLNAADLSKILWLQCLSTLNIGHMDEIFERIKAVEQLAHKLPPAVCAWFDVAQNIEGYFWDLTFCLDSLANNPHEFLAALEAGGIRKIKNPILFKCLIAGRHTARLLHKRAADLNALFALFIAAMADPASRIDSDMFAPKGGLAKLIASTKG